MWKVAAGAAVAVATSVGVVIWLLRKKPGKPCLLGDPNVMHPVKLLSKENVTHDVRRFTFKLPQGHVLGLPTGQHIYLRTEIEDDVVLRPYTPITSDEIVGYFSLVIKVYFKNKHPKFPAGGKMSQYLEAMSEGDYINVRGPNGLLVYAGLGTFEIRPRKGQPPRLLHVQKLGLIAGGTGITPMLQIIQHVLKDKNDRTLIWLLFANQSEDDIIMRDELDDLKSKHPLQLRVWYTVDKAPEAGWVYSEGFVNEQMIRDHLPPPGADTLVACCGPPPMIQHACKPNIQSIGYAPDNVFYY